jgi:hypothetical protein
MPEVPAQDLLSLAKNSAGKQTERMATPEELYALKRIAEVESALAELAKAENSSREDTVIATEIPVHCLSRNILRWQSRKPLAPVLKSFL